MSEKINALFQAIVSEGGSHLDYATLYSLITTEKFKCISPNNKIIYYYNKSTFLWKMIDLPFLENCIQSTLLTFVQSKVEKIKKDLSSAKQSDDDSDDGEMAIVKAKLQKKAKKYTEIKIKIGTETFIENIATSYLKQIRDEEFIDKLDKDDEDVLNFKNGILCLKTGAFRPRTDNDCFSMCLDYNYSKDVASDVKNDLSSIITKILNNDTDCYNSVLSFFGYCLTGRTSEQKLLFLFGNKAGNGKSTMYLMYDVSLSCYAQKLKPDTFSLKNQTYHKQFATFRRKRLVYIEEPSKDKQDTSKIKDFVDGIKQTNDVMYGTTADIKLNAKLAFAANDFLQFEGDEGMARRIEAFKLQNKFVSKEDYDITEDKTGLYVKQDLKAKFQNDAYKNAYINLLLPFAIQYYKKGLCIHNKFKDFSKKMNDVNDVFKQFIEDTFIKTENDDDRIGKEYFTDLYKEYTGCRGYTFKGLLKEIYSHDLSYDRLKRDPTTGDRGVILHLKLKEEPKEAEDPIEYGCESSKKPPKRIIPVEKKSKTVTIDWDAELKKIDEDIKKIETKDELDELYEQCKKEIEITTDDKPKKKLKKQQSASEDYFKLIESSLW